MENCEIVWKCMERIWNVYGTYEVMETHMERQCVWNVYMERIWKPIMERILHVWKNVWNVWNGNVDEEKAFLMGRHSGDDALPKCWREVEIDGTCVGSVERRIWVLGS